MYASMASVGAQFGLLSLHYRTIIDLVERIVTDDILVKYPDYLRWDLDQPPCMYANKTSVLIFIAGSYIGVVVASPAFMNCECGWCEGGTKTSVISHLRVSGYALQLNLAKLIARAKI